MRVNPSRLATVTVVTIIVFSFQATTVLGLGKKKRPTLQLPSVAGLSQLKRLVKRKRSQKRAANLGSSAGNAAGRSTSVRSRRPAREREEQAGRNARVSSDASGRDMETGEPNGQVPQSALPEGPSKTQSKSTSKTQATSITAPPTKPRPIN